MVPDSLPEPHWVVCCRDENNRKRSGEALSPKRAKAPKVQRADSTGSGLVHAHSGGMSGDGMTAGNSGGNGGTGGGGGGSLMDKFSQSSVLQQRLAAVTDDVKAAVR